ncbi:class I SAM-dependent methyltransferase [Neiella marina]|uniref:Class I SAM-dependent methyltransferase n=1 Tax=Neiella holothuriorum TaxID=2870530 RepID=A0ABS7EDT0_9GAMM|nr:class I SAM-dependent methyltransferase [Neiella holothuriorum]MBW8190482.1 class I SAM-dependent methyltransferase [Neiella holothuriorum]
MWDQEYDTDTYVYGKEANDFLQQHFRQLPKGNILLLAEGEGRNAVFLAKQGYEATAVDLSSVGLAKANKLAAEHGVTIETHCDDLATFDLGHERWDGIVSIFCHLPPTLRQDLYQRVERALKPNGVFLLEGYRPKQLSYKTGGPPAVEMMQSKEILLQELPNLQFSHLEELDRPVIEGINHSGMGAVVQAIASRRSDLPS